MIKSQQLHSFSPLQNNLFCSRIRVLCVRLANSISYLPGRKEEEEEEKLPNVWQGCQVGSDIVNLAEKRPHLRLEGYKIKGHQQSTF